MNKEPTVFAVFESKKTWEDQNPELAKCGYGRFLEDDESISSVIDEIRQGGTEVIAWRYQPGEFATLLEKLRLVSQSILWNLTDGYEFYFGANLPAFVQLASIPHVGSSSYTQMLCQNKHHLKAVAQSMGISVARGVSFNVEANGLPLIPSEMTPSYFVKPTRLDNSIGDLLAPPICADSAAALEAVNHLFAAGISDVSVEEYLPGSEFSVIAANGGSWVAECAHVTYGNAGYFSSTIKDNDNYGCEFLDGDREREMIRQTMRLAKAIKLQDYFRADFRCDLNGQPKMLEVNSGPFLASRAFDKLAIKHFGCRPAMFKAIILQSFQRQQNRIREIATEAR